MFDIESTSSYNEDGLVDGIEYDYVTRTSKNQGVMRTTGFIDTDSLNESGVWSLGLLQMDFFYRKKKWYAGQFVRKIIPTIEIPIKAVPFFSAVLNHQKPIMLSVLVRDVDKTFKNLKVKLPTINGCIDFAFMESFIEEIEAEHIQGVTEFLKVRHLDDCSLSKDEQDFLGNAVFNSEALSEKLKSVSWEEFPMGKLFQRIKTKKLPYKAKDLPSRAEGEYILPCLTSSFRNQGLNYYAPIKNATVLRHVISLPSNSDVYRAYYQSHDFTVLSDSYAIEWKKTADVLSSEQYLFLVTCINKVTDLPIYSYKEKLGGWNAVEHKKILLPTKNGVIDFDFMELVIRIIEKYQISNVSAYLSK